MYFTWICGTLGAYNIMLQNNNVALFYSEEEEEKYI